MWHKSNPALPQATYPRFPLRDDSLANGFQVDDSPWNNDDSNTFQLNSGTMSFHEETQSDNFGGMSENICQPEDDMFDISSQYLAYNVYHHEDDTFSEDISIPDINID
jgi:hypothetical protein